MPAPQVYAASMVGLATGELPIELARKLSGRRTNCASDAWATLADCFSTLARSPAQTLLLIDDVESCGAEAETDLVRLVRAADDAHISVVLSIETHLASTVSRWLMERSYLQIELSLWDLEQTHDFLRFSLAQCGRATPILTDTAVERLHMLARGVPRRLVQLADLALIAGAVAQMNRVDESVINQIARELPKPLSAAA
jgi:type II secretory pathway predicted ATPase ExeA